jgi:site-specific DNA recombinase
MVAAIYTRVSTVKQEEEGTSLDTQVERCLAFAQAKGLTVPQDLIIRETWTGTELHERPKLGKVRELIRERKVEAVVVYDLDRLSRKQLHQAVVLDECDQHDVTLHVVEGELDRSALGEFVRSARGLIAEIEREKIVERSKRGREARVKLRGLPISNYRAPYGYRFVDDIGPSGKVIRKARFELDDETAPTARWILQELAAGGSCNKIAASLNARGVPTPTQRAGAIWRASTISKLVRNPIYKGKPEAYRYKQEKTAEGNLRWNLSGDGVALSEGAAPALVDELTFDRAISVLSANKTLATRTVQPEGALLRGFVFCGYCGKTARVQRTKTKEHLGYHVYTCNSANASIYKCPSWSMLSQKLDREVWDRMVNELFGDEAMRKMLRKSKPKLDQGNVQKTLERHLKRLDTQIRNLLAVQGQAMNETALSLLANQLDELARQRGETENELDKVRRQSEMAAREYADAERAVQQLQQLREVVRGDGLTYEVKRRMVMLLKPAIHVKHTRDCAEGPRYTVDILAHPTVKASDNCNSYGHPWEQQLVDIVSLMAA